MLKKKLLVVKRDRSTIPGIRRAQQICLPLGVYWIYILIIDCSFQHDLKYYYSTITFFWVLLFSIESGGAATNDNL